MNVLTTVTLLQLGLALAVSANAQEQLPVYAKMDLYRAGGYDDGSDGISFAIYRSAGKPRQALIFSTVIGSWNGEIGVPAVSADGQVSPGLGQSIFNPTGPFSGYVLTDFSEALAGIFTADDLPLTAPPQLTLSVNIADGGIATDFRVLKPVIGQVFFMGDGATGTGTGKAQVFSCATQGNTSLS